MAFINTNVHECLIVYCMYITCCHVYLYIFYAFKTMTLLDKASRVCMLMKPLYHIATSGHNTLNEGTICTIE